MAEEQSFEDWQADRVANGWRGLLVVENARVRPCIDALSPLDNSRLNRTECVLAAVTEEEMAEAVVSAGFADRLDVRWDFVAIWRDDGWHLWGKPEPPPQPEGESKQIPGQDFDGRTF